MPFDPTTQINPTPDVKIFFEGLLMLVPEQDATSKRCDVYVINHHSSDHELSLDVSVDRPQQPNFPFLRLGTRILRTGLEISTDAPAGVKKYAPNPGSSVPGAYSFSEAIDFKSMHPGGNLNAGGAHPGMIKIRDGVLYTAMRRPAEARLERNTECHDRAPVGVVLGANIAIPLNGRLRLKWGPQDFLDLPRKNDPEEDPPGTKYIIWINNSRPVPPTPGTNDFKHLYHGINGVATSDQFNLVFKKCGAKMLDTPRIPCMPGVIGG